jgi:hypothetical protein
VAKFHEARVSVKFEDGRPTWAVELQDTPDHPPVVGFGETIQEAASGAASARRQQLAGKDPGTNQAAAEFFDPDR